MTTDATAIGSYSVWAIPPDDVSDRIKKVMLGLRDEFGGAPAEIEPHFPIVGSIRMTREDALNKLRTLIQSYPPGCISAFTARVDEIVARPFYYQCVCLRIHYSHQLKEISRCCSHKWGLRFPGVPYLSLLYGKLTEEERKKARDKVSVLDETITSLSFPITRLALYKINYKDKTLKSWKKIAELPLQLN